MSNDAACCWSGLKGTLANGSQERGEESLQCQSICSCVNVKVPRNSDKPSAVAASTLISLAVAIVHRQS